MELVTRRFVLRDFGDGDTAAFEAYHNDPRSQEFYGAEQANPEHARELIDLFKAWAAEQPRLNYQFTGRPPSAYWLLWAAMCECGSRNCGIGNRTSAGILGAIHVCLGGHASLGGVWL